MQLQPAILLFAVGQCWTTAAGATVALPDDLRTGIHGIFIFITLLFRVAAGVRYSVTQNESDIENHLKN